MSLELRVVLNVLAACGICMSNISFLRGRVNCKRCTWWMGRIILVPEVVREAIEAPIDSQRKCGTVLLIFVFPVGRRID